MRLYILLWPKSEAIMPKGPRKKTHFKSTPFNITLLLVKFIFIKIGTAPLLVVQTLLGILTAIPRLRLSLHFLRTHRKVGRPRKFHISSKTKIIVTISVFLIFITTYTTFLLTAAYQLPNPERLTSPNEPLTTQIYDRNGELLFRIYEDKNRTLVKLSEVPKHLIRATIAAEDKNFYFHIGIDPIAIARALYNNFNTGTQEGASTITQQLIKNSLLTPERTYSRKIKEIILALWAERLYSKDQILQMYFNEAPYGGSIVGIAAAAQTYFDKSPSELTLAESTYLAGLPVSPTQFSPYGTSPELAKLRQKEVLQRMVDEKYITQAQAEVAFTQDLNIRPLMNSINAPHFVFYIRNVLSQKYGSRVVSQGGLKIYTTLDLKLQQKVEKIVKDELNTLAPLNVKNGAAMVLDSKSGQILAMVGSRDYHYPNFGNFNVTLSPRQPGSSLKPIIYALAFEKGFSPSSIILDTPVTFKDEWGNAYSPVNYDGRFSGPVTMRQALARSLNTPAVKLLATIGIEPVAQTAKELGITTLDNPERFGLSLALGSAEVKMIEMMGAYNAFAQMGKFRSPTGILKVIDPKGEILEEYQPEAKEIISPQIAYLISNILSDDNARSLAFGSKSLLHIPGFEVAVKTGTSDNKRDNWTFGYTPSYAVGAWVGNPDNTPMNPALASGITGAAPIWNKIMHQLLDGSKPVAFKKPSEIAEVKIDGRKDLSIVGTIPKAMVRVQKSENKLLYSDAFSSYSTPSAQAAINDGSTN